ACRGFVERGVAGVYLAPFVTPSERANPNRKIVETLRKAGIAVVLLDRDIVPFLLRSDFDLVAVDHLRGQARITEFLIGLGHRRFGFWLWKHATDTLHQRSAGILPMLSKSRVPIEPSMVQACEPDDLVPV